jgi:hypothetical protein
MESLVPVPGFRLQRMDRPSRCAGGGAGMKNGSALAGDPARRRPRLDHACRQFSTANRSSCQKLNRDTMKENQNAA